MRRGERAPQGGHAPDLNHATIAAFRTHGQGPCAADAKVHPLGDVRTSVGSSAAGLRSALKNCDYRRVRRRFQKKGAIQAMANAAAATASTE